ncbi:MAG: CHASE domain-containing protein [Pseudomonadota bacterium]
MLASLRFRRHRERVYTWLIAIAGIAVAVAAAWLARDYAVRMADDGFRREVAARSAALDAAVARHEQMVRSLSAFVATRDSMSAADFRAFVTGMSPGGQGAQAMQWMPRIPAAARAAFEKTAQREFPRYRITEQLGQWELGEAAVRDTYAPVRYIEPPAGNEPAVGFDLLSDPLYADALLRADRSGGVVATERLVLLQEEGVHYGVMLVSAVKNADGVTLGYVAGVFRVSDLLQAAIASLPSVGLHISVTDASGPGSERALHVFSDRLNDVSDLMVVPMEQKLSPAASQLFASYDLKVTDRTWRVYFEPGPGYFAPLPPIPDWAAAILVLLITGLITALLLVMQKRSQLLARASLSDGLTGLANRAFCDRMLLAEWERAVRFGKPVSVVLIDIDRFADYNARLGPLAGDDALRRVAVVLSTVPARSSDMVCRYAGDRFAVILPETGNEGASQLAHRAVAAVKGMSLTHPGRQPEPVLTVSAVAATAQPQRGDSLPAFMSSAVDVLDSGERAAGNVVLGLSVAAS